MEILRRIDDLLMGWGVPESVANTLDQFIAFAVVLMLAFAADWCCRCLLLRAVGKLVSKTKVEWDDIVFGRSVLAHLSHIVPAVIIYLLVPVAFADTNFITLHFLRRICLIYIVLAFTAFVHSFLKAVYVVYSRREQLRDRPLKGLLQIVQVLLWFVGSIVVVSILIDKSPLSLLAGLGASAAILMLVFKDTIIGFVSGVQLTANDMLKVGDWITMPKYGADGPVIEVTLNTVKVRNFDNTIVTVPPYALVSDSFQNWRGMRESGGRRVKRSINIDMTTVCFCTPEMLEHFCTFPLLRECMQTPHRKTNLGVFRAYLDAYLASLPTVNHELMTLVRQLQPTDRGIPIELYFFSVEKDWVPYERIQADVFDHVLAIIPEFRLRVFQSPTGSDFQALRQESE